MRTRNKGVVATPWYIRLLIYVVVGVAGLILVYVGQASPEQVDGWLVQAGGLASVIGSLVAGLNVTHDSKAGGDAAPATAPTAPAPEPTPPVRPTLDELREIIASNREG